MARIDEIKEELNYLKVWLGIVVVTVMSLIGWLVGNYDCETKIKIYLDMVAITEMSVRHSFMHFLIFFLNLSSFLPPHIMLILS